MPDEANYQAVLDDLLNKRAELDAAINAIRRIMGQPVEETANPIGQVPQGKRNGVEVESDSFLGLSISDASKKYLRMIRRPRSAKAITDMLQLGGLQSFSKNLYRTVWTTLNREENVPGGFVKAGKDWGLAEWYPDRALRKRSKDEDAEEGNGKSAAKADQKLPSKARDKQEGAKT